MLSLQTARARGEEPGCPEPDYRVAIDAALQEYERHRFVEARALFARAHALCPSARTERGLGLVAFEQARYVESAQRLQAALSSQVRPLDTELRAQTSTLALRVASFVTTVQLSLQPAASSLRVDGGGVELPASGELLLPVGEHVLEVAALGHASQRVPLDTYGGERIALVVRLLPLALPQAQDVPLRLARSPDHETSRALQLAARAHAVKRRRAWLWTSLGGACLSAALVLGFALSSRTASTRHAISALPVATRAGP